MKKQNKPITLHKQNTQNTQIMNAEHFENVMSLLDATGLNWEVKKEQVIHPSGLTTGHYGLFKYEIDEAEPKQCFAMVKDRYQVFSNFALADTLLRATEQLDISINRGGQLESGAKVFLQAKLDDVYIGKSDIKRWITVLNSHDGSSAIGFGSSNTVVVCENTFYMAHKELSKFRHTVSAQQRIDTAIENLQKSMIQDAKLYDNFERMSKLRPNENVVQAVIDKMFTIDSRNTTTADISTRKANQLRQFAQAYTIERDLEGDTLWGLFNAVTRYTNHMVPHSSAEDKTGYIMTGGGFDINTNAYNVIMDYINSNTATPLVQVG